MEMKKSYDLIVIGGGPAGYVAAIRAAQLGAKTLLVEKDQLGGTCLNQGCIPTKAMLADARLYDQVIRSSVLKMKGIQIDWKQMLLRKNEVVKRLVTGVQFLVNQNGIELFQGKAKLVSPQAIEIEDRKRKERMEGRKMIIATGSVSANLPNVEIDGKVIVTSKEMLEITSVPEELMIIGGGVIGMEFACLFNSLGTKVTVMEMLPKIIATEDEEIVRGLTTLLKKRGIQIHTNIKVEEAQVKKGIAEVRVVDQEGRESLFKSRKVLMAIGRSPYTEDLGIETLNIALDRNFIKVNEKMETNIPGIYAIGDVTGRQMLAHKASAEGMVAAENALGGRSRVDYSKIPNCIYTLPEVASVGLTEKEAKDKGLKVMVGRFPFQSNGKALATGESEGFVKVIAEKELGQIVGIHILGDHATDLIGGPVLAMALEMTVEELGKTVQAHPTLNEALSEAALDALKEAIHLPKKRAN